MDNSLIREVSDEAYLLACQILHVDSPLPNSDNVYVKWHRLSMVSWAKRALMFPLDLVYSGFMDPTLYTPAMFEKFHRLKKLQARY